MKRSFYPQKKKQFNKSKASYPNKKARNSKKPPLEQIGFGPLIVLNKLRIVSDALPKLMNEIISISKELVGLDESVLPSLKLYAEVVDLLVYL